LNIFIKALFLLLLSNNAFTSVYQDIADKALLIKKSSESYFVSTGYWPNSIRELIDSNYLQDNSYEKFSIKKENSNIVINIKNIDKNSKLRHYLIDGLWVKNTLLLKVFVPKIEKKIHSYFCSNIFCRTQ
jgi:hypothetical protein